MRAEYINLNSVIWSFSSPPETHTCAHTYTHTHSHHAVTLKSGFGHLKGCKWLELFKMAAGGPSKHLYSAVDLNCVPSLALTLHLFYSGLF